MRCEHLDCARAAFLTVEIGGAAGPPMALCDLHLQELQAAILVRQRACRTPQTLLITYLPNGRVER
jgi:hypothetical protein